MGLPRLERRREAPDPIWASCERQAVDVHEPLARSACGPIDDDSNAVEICRACHRWVGDNPREALAMGLRRSRYPGRNP